jgi:hypothetical protein
MTMRSSLPSEFDGSRTFDEVLSDLRALGQSIDGRKRRVYVYIGTGPEPALGAARGVLTEAPSDDPRDDLASPRFNVESGGDPLAFAFAIPQERFKHARLITMDGTDYLALRIEIEDLWVLITDA